MSNASARKGDQDPARSATKETAIVLLSQAWIAGSAIITQSILAWFLGPADRGAYAVCVLFASVLGVVFTFGVDRGAQYFVMSRNLPVSDAIMAMTLVVITGSAVAVGVGVILVDSPLQFFGKAEPLAFMYSLGLVPVMILWAAYRLQSAGLRRFGFLAKIDIVRTILNVALLLILVVALGLAVPGALLAQTVCLIVVILLVVVDFARRGHLRLARPPVTAIRSICSYGLKYYFARIGHVIDMGMGTFLLALLATQVEIGLFAAASALTLALLMLPQSIEVSLLPRIASDPAGRPDLVASVARFSGASTLMMTLILVILAHPVVNIVLSPEFLEAVPIIRVLAIGAVIQAFGIILMSYFRGNNQPQICSLAVWTGLTTNGVGLLVLYPVFGVIGAAFAMTAGFAVRTLTLVVFFCRSTDITLLQLLVPTKQDLTLLNELRAIVSRLGGQAEQRW